MANNSNFHQNFQSYTEWKQRLTRSIEEYRDWSEQQGLATPEASGRVRQALDTLATDRLTIAFVAEFSRGKTELINAVFFSDFGRRLLPSTAGRTTMCPTELMWDSDREEAYLRLLPIETRAKESSIAELKRDPRHWVYYPLNVDSPEQLEGTLQELALSKRVSTEEAARLGLYSDTRDNSGDDTVEIPRWRHAVVSFPHPLLQQGLVILDTPGLNALGSEPELTLSTLPSAQALLFVLAADTGVTRSDLEMWQHHIKGFQNNRQRGLAVVLNKIDTLWDELRPANEVEQAIASQRQATARILGVDDQSVFPVSAQKALLAKVKGDHALLERSALSPLETYLAEDMLEARQHIILDTVQAEVGQLVDNTRGLLAQQLGNTKRQLGELEDLRDKSADVIHHLLEKTRSEQARYLETVSRFQISRNAFGKKAQELRVMMDIAKAERIMEERHREMLHSWTTHGMKKVMKALFDDLRRAIQATTAQSEQIRKTVRNIYQQFQNEFGFSSVQPYKFSTMKFRVELELLYQEADAFRRSPSVAMSEQSHVVRRFYQALVSRAHAIFTQLGLAQDQWLTQALTPLLVQIQEHRNLIEKRLENLQKIGRSKHTLETRIQELEGQYAEQARQLTALRNMHNGIHAGMPPADGARPKPRLVSQHAH
jgi:hypothetical protein